MNTLTYSGPVTYACEICQDVHVSLVKSGGRHRSADQRDSVTDANRIGRHGGQYHTETNGVVYFARTGDLIRKTVTAGGAFTLDTLGRMPIAA
jgi:hypothetical protein